MIRAEDKICWRDEPNLTGVALELSPWRKMVKVRILSVPSASKLEPGAVFWSHLGCWREKPNN